MGEDEGGVLPGKASPGCTLASQIQPPATGSKSKEGNVMLEPVCFSSSIWNIRQACRDISLQQLEPCTAGVPEG